MTRWMLTLLALAALLGCEEERPPPTYRVTFIATSDGDPLAAVRVIADGTPLGDTGEDGTLGVTLQGREGQAVAVSAQCPQGHRAPEQLPLLTLRSFRGVDPTAADRGIEMTIACPPSDRIAAVVIRASGQPDLPVMMRGREVARTDESGVAHLMLTESPNTTFRVELDTTEREDLRPQNPGATFTLPDSNEIFLYDQPFQIQQRRRRRRRPRPAPMGPTLPMRIN